MVSVDTFFFPFDKTAAARGCAAAAAARGSAAAAAAAGSILKS